MGCEFNLLPYWVGIMVAWPWISYLWTSSSLLCKRGRYCLVYNTVRINVHKPLTHCRPLTKWSCPSTSFIPFQQCAFVGWGLGREINSLRRTSNITSTVYLKPAQMLEAKISSLFLEKSFPVLLEFLPYWVLFCFSDRITSLPWLVCYITWLFPDQKLQICERRWLGIYDKNCSAT